jgi:hypothetical protein
MQGHDSYFGETKNPVDFGQRNEAGETIRVAQLPSDFSHALIETSFCPLKKL